MKRTPFINWQPGSENPASQVHVPAYAWHEPCELQSPLIASGRPGHLRGAAVEKAIGVVGVPCPADVMATVRTAYIVPGLRGKRVKRIVVCNGLRTSSENKRTPGPVQKL